MSAEGIKQLPNNIENVEESSWHKKQFLEKHILPLSEKENLEYTLVHPNGEDDRTEWVVIIGGFASTKEMWREEIFDLVKKSGKSVVFVTPDKGVMPNKKESEYFGTVGKSIPKTIQWKASAVKKLIDHLGIRATSLVGQSQGAPIVASLAGLYPESIKNVLLDNPSGVSKDSALGFYARAVAESLHERFSAPKVNENEIHPDLLKDDKEIWDSYNKKFARHRMWRLMKEVPDVGRADILPVLSGIKQFKMSTGAQFPEIVLLNANKDMIFKADRIEKTIGPTPLNDYIDRWIMYADKDVGHSKYRRPQPGMLPQVFNENRRNGVILQVLGEENEVGTRMGTSTI